MTKSGRERKAMIVDAGRTALLQRGIAHVRLSDIANAAVLTPPGVLYHYQDVFALYDEVFASSVEEYYRVRIAAVDRAVGARDKLRACAASGVPRTPRALEATRLLIELHPYLLRDAVQLERFRAFVREQAEIYAGVLREGAESGEFRLRGDIAAIAQDFIALEDGYSAAVVSETLTADYVESRLWAFAETACGLG